MRVLLLFVAACCFLLSGCASNKPKAYLSKTGWASDAKGRANIRIRAFQTSDGEIGGMEALARAASVVGPMAIKGLSPSLNVAGGQGIPYVASIYDVTDDVQYLGSVTNGDSWFGWLEHQVSPGKRVLMLTSTKEEALSATPNTWDFIELDVVEGKNTYVAVSQKGRDRKARFVEVKIRPQDEAFCFNLTGGGYERKQRTSEHLEKSGLDYSEAFFSAFCSYLVPDALIATPNQLAVDKFNLVKSNTAALKATEYLYWQANGEKNPSYDLMRVTVPGVKTDRPDSIWSNSSSR